MVKESFKDLEFVLCRMVKECNATGVEIGSESRKRGLGALLMQGVWSDSGAPDLEPKPWQTYPRRRPNKKNSPLNRSTDWPFKRGQGGDQHMCWKMEIGRCGKTGYGDQHQQSTNITFPAVKQAFKSVISSDFEDM